MYLRIHNEPGGGRVVAVCDRELLGKTLSHGDIEITITKDFYGETLATEDEVRHALLHAGNANIIGNRVIEIAISLDRIDRSSCILIGSVPHAQFI
jgi:hypothetical protein